MDDISVLVCDDSALMRNLISNIIDKTPGMHVVGKAMNGQFCLDKIPLVHPDVIVLDIEMPVMNGVQFLEERKRQRIDVPVVILSSIATTGADVTIRCLELGASDFLTKPNGSITNDLSSVATRLVELISSYGGSYARRHGKRVYNTELYSESLDKLSAAVRRTRASGTAPALNRAGNDAAAESNSAQVSSSIERAFASLRSTASQFSVTSKSPAVIEPLRKGGSIDVIAIGISTGGPNALRDVFKFIDPHIKQPILVVQHMPAGFTKEFAASLNNICPLEVKEAEDGDLVKSGRVLIAPGNYHIYVEKKPLGAIVRLSQEPQRNGHRPSVDYLFESVAALYQNHALGVIMTGMGRDGAAMLAEMRRQGAWTLGQDEASSIVYGMPKVAYEMGAVQKQVALRDMADEISKLAREHKF